MTVFVNQPISATILAVAMLEVVVPYLPAFVAAVRGRGRMHDWCSARIGYSTMTTTLPLACPSPRYRSASGTSRNE